MFSSLQSPQSLLARGRGKAGTLSEGNLNRMKTIEEVLLEMSVRRAVSGKNPRNDKHEITDNCE